jgi:hypothetical protein
MKKLFLSLAFVLCVCNAAQAQGLVGSMAETRFGRTDEQSLKADQQYEHWKDASLALSGIAGVLGVCSAGYLIRKHGKAAIKKACLIAVAAPGCSHVLGTVFVNNMWRWF